MGLRVGDSFVAHKLINAKRQDGISASFVVTKVDGDLIYASGWVHPKTHLGHSFKGQKNRDVVFRGRVQTEESAGKFRWKMR